MFNKVIKRAIFICVCLISVQVSAQTEYFLWVLVGEENKPETQELLTNDPIQRHDRLTALYIRENNLKERPNILGAGEMEKIDGKYTRINETSQSYFKETPDGLKHIENFMNRLVDYKIEYIKYDKENEHLAPILKILKDLRHDIRNQIGSVYGIFSLEISFANTETVESSKTNLLACINNINKLNELVPNNRYDKIQELYQLAVDMFGIVSTRDQRSAEYFIKYRSEYFMDVLNSFDIQPSLKNTILVIKTETPTEEKTQTPVVEQNKKTTSSEIKELISSIDLLDPNYYKSDRETLDFAREISSTYAAENIPELISKIFEKINQNGMDQKDMMIMFRSGLYEYMEERKDTNDNLELLMLFTASAYKAEKDGYIKISMDYDQKMRAFFTYNYGTYVYSSQNNSKLSDNQKLMIKNAANMMPIKIAEPKLPTIRK